MTDPPPPKERRPPRPVTAAWLQRAATYYLERYSATEAHLTRVLERKVARRCRERGEDPAAHAAAIAATVSHLVELRLVDDRQFAEGRLASLRRRGTSARMSAMKLGEKGVERALVDELMAAQPADDVVAARAYARRRRLGPHRLRERAERRDRDVAALMRAGFSFRDAAAAVDGEIESGDPI